jgi:uncharacterized protein (TIGR03437 family)
LSIVSPINGATVISGQLVSVAVTLTGGVAASGVQLLIPALGISDALSQSPYTFAITFPADALGPQKIIAMATTGPADAIFSNTITLVVVSSSPVASLSTNFTTVPLSYIGQTAHLRVIGKYVDGSNSDVTMLPSTTLTSQDTAVAKVDTSGNVTAVGAGKTTITAKNGVLSAPVAVSVPATIRGDLNGDGKVDQNDLNLLLVAVGTPISGPFDARDVNGDGVLDSKDVDALQPVCYPRCIPGGRIVPVTGVVNGASFAANSLAPGGLFSIFMSGLTVSELTAPTAPFPTSLGGATVTVNATAVPLLYVSPTQINAQMPYELSLGPATLVVTADGSTSIAVPIDIAAAAPGLFLSSGSRAIAQNQDYSINSSTNPAYAGSVVVAYFTGQGALDRSIASGDVAPLADLSRPTSVTSATVGGLPAQVLFSGMTPTFVGLAQANIVIPNVPSGDYPLVITVGGSASNSGTISVGTK